MRLIRKVYKLTFVYISYVRLVIRPFLFFQDGTCYHRSWEWLVMMAWPAILLLVQTFLTPGIVEDSARHTII